MISTVHQWIYFSLFYPVGTKSAMATPRHDEVIIDNTSTSVDFSAEAVAGASTSGLNLGSTSNLAGQNSAFPYMDFSNFSPTCGSFIRPPLYPFGQGLSRLPKQTSRVTFSEDCQRMTSSLATGSNHARPETIARARFDSQQWQPPQQWPTFSFNLYNSGYFGNYGQAQHANELSQLQKTVKSLKEKLASVSSSNKQVSHDDSREVSRKKKRCVLHEISDSDDALSDISSEELDVWSGSEDGQTEDGFHMPSFSDLSTVKACSNTSDKLTSKTSVSDKHYSKMDKLSKMATEFEATDSYGEKINEDLAKTVNSGMKATFSASASRDLMNKYLKPENCDWIRTPLLNPELWNSDCLSDDFKNNEKLLYKNQKLMTKSMIPIVQIMNKCLDKSDAEEIFDLACDAFKLLSYAHKDKSYIRRLLLKPAVSRPYKKLCTPTAPVTEYLFGNDLQKQIKDLNEARKMTQNISGHKKPPHFYKTSKRYQTQRYGSDRNSDRNPKQKSFLDKRVRFHKKVKPQGAGRKQ